MSGNLNHDNPNSGSELSLLKTCRSAVGSIPYELAIGYGKGKARDFGISILAENVFLGSASDFPASAAVRQHDSPESRIAPASILTPYPPATPGVRYYQAIARLQDGRAAFQSERDAATFPSTFTYSRTKSALGNLPAEVEEFPISTWLKQLLTTCVHRVELKSDALRSACPPEVLASLNSKGANLPWIVERLSEDDPQMFQSWVGHVQTSLPDLAHIEVQKLEKPHDYLRYLVLVNTKGFRVPSWVASDGTLRLMALTLLAYTRNQDQIYLIEEPENGIHPQALETIFQSLSSVYDGQVLMATHSPLILGQADLDQILCFVKTADGEIDIIRGSQHPILKEWQHDISLGTLFAAGVLG